MSRKYAIERKTLDGLRIVRKDLHAYARSVKNADDLRASRDELMKTVQTYTTPKAGEQVKYEVIDGVAHIPIAGQLTPSADPCGAFMGMNETEYGFIQAALIAAEDDDSVNEIALDVDSPGGYLAGLDETAQLIGAVTKPTTAYVGSMAASAAYWLASQADRIVARSPASEIGSIGVAMEEYDDDQALANEGIVHRVYTSTDAPDKRPDTSTEEGQAKVVAELDALHGVFVRRVAEGRGVSEAKVNKDFGHGGMLIAEKAMSVGMIDEVIGSHITRESKSEKPVAVGNVQAAGPEKTKGVNKMTPEELAALQAKAMQDGITAERKRMADLDQYQGKFGAAVDAIVAEAKVSGKNLEDIKVALDVAVLSAKLDGENAPAVQTAVTETASGIDGLSAEDAEAAAMFGLSASDWKKYNKESK